MLVGNNIEQIRSTTPPPPPPITTTVVIATTQHCHQLQRYTALK
jgi:hypothetical protein